MNRIAPLSAPAAFTSPEHRLVTVIGAGGKTSLLHWIAMSRVAAGQRVVVTTTTKILPLQDVETVLLADGPDYLDRLRRALRENSCIVTAKRYDKATGKLIGLAPETVDALHHSGVADAILVEADGAARKPLKAPGPHEPVIPFQSDICIGVMGLDALGNPFSDQTVHRPEHFAGITGAALGESLSAAHMISVTMAPGGLFKGCPPNCERIVLLNKADIPGGRELVHRFKVELAGNDAARMLPWFAGSCHRQTLYRINP
ncbi:MULTISPECIES: selenium cofactor biosynthesis protein YqeC [unclassified Pseudodesulfovibrio]|uniref:selenium cofactor biosynthesis protein YqeC n=1 Tax=unclassified Pseudodesulfovibrio TaxID=2661612 RepID=UPI000FEB98F6|nr:MULTISPECIES: selenium cofactor biosynthesis protein YqeC [unclassified Pseudodesulfovibrio]MCJ2164731.1 selenium cofactor biosynthesis protein YqeC [Pseudodesulfovibrio sp. S3-i]RWU04080.1 putative selenium-dependent hydroxylase accessory protein YqeC [Pseudodesulfovibrio sp. S3]